MFGAHRAHHQERQIVSIQPLVAVALFWWPCRVQVGSEPDDEHDALETCRVKNKNKYTENNLCVTLVIYQESIRMNCLIVLFTELSSCNAVGSAYVVLTTEITCNIL
jgi:hypothetical protein